MWCAPERHLEHLAQAQTGTPRLAVVSESLVAAKSESLELLVMVVWPDQPTEESKEKTRRQQTPESLSLP
jgi:hypothetical protein